MLDPAPAQPLPAELLARVDILTPNETEALMLLGRPPARGWRKWGLGNRWLAFAGEL
jgi:sugar/nucleoside kinase (ribokinase family)